MAFYSRFLRARTGTRGPEEAAEWHPVTSSNVKAICWREGKGLGVWFLSKKSGDERVYWYPRKTYDDYLSCLHSSSPGGWVYYFLRRQDEPFDGPHSPPG